MKPLLKKNEMTTQQLVTERNDVLRVFDYVDDDHKRHIFASISDGEGRLETIYISPNAKKALEEKGEPALAEMKYARCCKDEEGIDPSNPDNWVPCLMIVGNTRPPKFTFGADLLRK